MGKTTTNGRIEPIVACFMVNLVFFVIGIFLSEPTNHAMKLCCSGGVGRGSGGYSISTFSLLILKMSPRLKIWSSLMYVMPLIAAFS